IAGGVPVVLGNQSSKIEMYTDPATQNPAFRMAGSTATLTIAGGQLAGLMEVANQTVPHLLQQLNTWTQHLVRGVDEIHATSIPLTGSFSTLAGLRGVTDTTIPLAKAGLAFTPQAGTLYISVTNKTTGARTLKALTIDPAAQSLQDVATAIGGVP